MRLAEIFSTLEEMLPLLGTITNNQDIGILATRLLQLGEEEIGRRRATSGLTRQAVLADAEKTFIEAKSENEKLKKLGHE